MTINERKNLLQALETHMGAVEATKNDSLAMQRNASFMSTTAYLQTLSAIHVGILRNQQWAFRLGTATIAQMQENYDI